MEYFNDGWVIAVLQIIAIDIVLGGDNAIIIALACRNLPKHQRRAGILWGTAGAIILRVILVFFATSLMEIWGLRSIGGILLIWLVSKISRGYLALLCFTRCLNGSETRFKTVKINK